MLWPPMNTGRDGGCFHLMNALNAWQSSTCVSHSQSHLHTYSMLRMVTSRKLHWACAGCMMLDERFTKTKITTSAVDEAYGTALHMQEYVTDHLRKLGPQRVGDAREGFYKIRSFSHILELPAMPGFTAESNVHLPQPYPHKSTE